MLKFLNYQSFETVVKLRVKLYEYINYLLNPQNTSLEAINLQESFVIIEKKFSGSTRNYFNVFKIKAAKAKALTKCLDYIFDNFRNYDFLSKVPINSFDRRWLKSLLSFDLLYYGPITVVICKRVFNELKIDLNDDPCYQNFQNLYLNETINEIYINSYQEIFIECKNKITEWNISFISNEHLIEVIKRMICESNLLSNNSILINEAKPICDFGHILPYIRGAAILPPASKEPILSLRIHPEQNFNLDHLLDFEMFNSEVKDFLIACQQAGLSVAIAGTMGTGKTTLLSALAEHWPDHGRKAFLEDTPEINPKVNNKISLKIDENDLTVDKLTKACKRHSIKYIALSEARDGSAWEIIQLAQNILGCLITFHYTFQNHVNSIDNALLSLVGLCKQNKNIDSELEIKNSLASILDILILIEQDNIDKKRRIKSIAYLKSYNTLNNFRFDYQEIFSHINGLKYQKFNIPEYLKQTFVSKGVSYRAA
jgi:Flp pilus assembly CpaF family ATPase